CHGSPGRDLRRPGCGGRGRAGAPSGRPRRLRAGRGLSLLRVGPVDHRSSAARGGRLAAGHPV
ncbi:uncharacterized protein METZ01_LOCUS107255, partial [marine metagenome]